MKTSKKAAEMTERELARYIDQSVLKPEFTVDEIKKYAQEDIDFGCATICINPASLPIVAPMVEGTDTGLCVVCDFPFGLATTEAKALLAEEYCSKWNIEDLDIVANYGRLRSGDLDFVIADLKPTVEACHKYGTKVKVIIETDFLTPEQIADGTRCAIAAGADFIKSSTGFVTGVPSVGATNEVVAAMMEAGEGKIKVKGSGAIRTQEHFFELIDMGIDRMGVGYRSTPIVLGMTPEEAKHQA
ncbi:deoxyribose-phosphate aldolase [Atopobium sp. oral taxon 810]|uniref:deoxyribose-phosphate aldolase n=1 Tax=Atopobium sp. oral taxon 810 TaxID=712158 RepID=UPI000396FEA1|nr:deoxyribose-phosphate aldolase [Atopobium sp. oral taxon 810]ERI05496.1 deoxyribose-phosphate aldolase [Atopobium sp. oral taxon 810 str. F0209]